MKKFFTITAILFATICSAQTSTNGPGTVAGANFSYAVPPLYLPIATIMGTESKLTVSNEQDIILIPSNPLQLHYNIPVLVRVAGKNATNTAERPITDIVGTPGQVGIVTITPTSDPQIFSVKNTSTTLNNSSSITWTAKNELGNTITTGETYTLIPPDPATMLEAKISPE